MTLSLENVDWNAALAALTKEKGKDRLLSEIGCAQILGLSALYTSDFQSAHANLTQACRLEPLNPLQEFRKALLFARFGETDQATVILNRLKKVLSQNPLLEYMRALLALKAGRPQQARAITAGLENSHPDFAYSKFLRLQAQIVLSNKSNTFEKYLINLPADRQLDPLWADILVKIALLHPKDGPKQAEKYLGKKLIADSTAYNAVARAITWATASIEELEVFLENEGPDSKAEELILFCIVERLKQSENNLESVNTVTRLRKRFPERGALTRIESVFITRLAMETFSKGDYETALRLTERCFREHSYETVFYQNLAALFTLLRETNAYHGAWSSLNRHQYRLIALGKTDRFTVAQTAMSHRLFAQQARVGGRSTIFRQTLSEEINQSKRLSVNRDGIAADPDLLRQWLYHNSAEIIFKHFLLSDNPDRAFLYPSDRDEAAARSEGLATLAESLTILVPEEGTLLAGRMIKRWQNDAAKIHSKYSDNQDPGEDEEVSQLQFQHLELLGDLALFCVEWYPDPGQIAMAEELIKIILAEKSFLDERVLYKLERQPDSEISYPILVLAHHLRATAGIEKDTILTAEQRSNVIDNLISKLLLHISYGAYGRDANSQKDSVTYAMSFIDRARDYNPTDADVELEAARFLSLGEFYDEAKGALRRFYRLVDATEQESLSEAEKLDQILKDKNTKGASKKRENRKLDEPIIAKGENRLSEIEREIGRSPSAWRLYEELVQELIKLDQFDRAVIWADSAVAHCLNKESQMNARTLAIETRGLKTLAEENPKAVHLYVSGAHEPTRKVLQSLGEVQELDYTLLFLLGKCQLANEDPYKAQQTFQTAIGRCERQLHRTLLRYLTNNIDNAYLTIARSTITAMLQDGQIESALDKAVAQFSRLQEPSAWLVDVARIFYSAALAHVGDASLNLSRAKISIEAEWSEQLNAVMQQEDNLEKALSLAEMAENIHPSSAPAAQALKKRIQALKYQIAISEFLKAAGKFLNEKKFEEVLALADKLDDNMVSEPRIVRIKVLTLLGIRHFEEADRLIGEYAGSANFELKSFIEEYPNLLFRHRLTTANRYLHDTKLEEAIEILKNTRSTTDKQAMELAYCHAFGLTMHGYHLRRQDPGNKVQKFFRQAIDLVEEYLGEARLNGQTHVIELYDRLEKELEGYDGE